jgi:hypothetical protein
MFNLIAKVLKVLENDFTKGEIELTSFSIEDEHKDRLKEIEGEKFFKEYKISFYDNSFRIEAIPIDKGLENNLLMFDRLKNLFEDLPVETGIGCGGGIFLFTYKGKDYDKNSLNMFNFSKKELLKEIVKMIEDIQFQIKVSHKNKTSGVKDASYWDGYASGLGASIIDHIYCLIEYITKEEIDIIYDKLEWTDKKDIKNEENKLL